MAKLYDKEDVTDAYVEVRLGKGHLARTSVIQDDLNPKFYEDFRVKVCGDHGACENLMGSYQCICEPGYQPDISGKQCEDVNECLNPLNCRKGQCRNTPGSFQCICPSGMKYNDDSKACEDVDECIEGAQSEYIVSILK